MFGFVTNTFYLSMKFTGIDSTNFKSYRTFSWTIFYIKVYLVKKSNV